MVPPAVISQSPIKVVYALLVQFNLSPLSSNKQVARLVQIAQSNLNKYSFLKLFSISVVLLKSLSLHPPLLQPHQQTQQQLRLLLIPRPIQQIPQLQLTQQRLTPPHRIAQRIKHRILQLSQQQTRPQIPLMAPRQTLLLLIRRLQLILRRRIQQPIKQILRNRQLMLLKTARHRLIRLCLRVTLLKMLQTLLRTPLILLKIRVPVRMRQSKTIIKHLHLWLWLETIQTALIQLKRSRQQFHHLHLIQGPIKMKLKVRRTLRVKALWRSFYCR